MNSEAKLDSLIQQADAKMRQFGQGDGQPVAENELPVSEMQNEPVMESKKTYKMTPYHFQLMIQEAKDSAHKKFRGLAEGVKKHKIRLTEAQIGRLRLSEGAVDEVASFATHGQIFDAIKEYMISTNRVSSAWYRKEGDGTLRLANSRAATAAAKEAIQGVPRYIAANKELVPYWDNNSLDAQGNKGAWRSFKTYNLMWFKSGELAYDFTKVNADAFNKLTDSERAMITGAIAKYTQQYGKPPIVVQ